jgi:hypothetical protein
MTEDKTPDIETTGKLTDYALMTEGEYCGKYGLRLDDVPYPVLSHVDAFLLRMQKNTMVDVKIKNVNGVMWINKITKAKNQTLPNNLSTAERLKKAGFGQPTTVPAKDELLSDAEVQALKARADAAAKEKAEIADKTPLVSGIKIVQGQITELDLAGHHITVKDKAGAHHEMVWAAPLNEKMAKLKQWFFV